MGRESHRQRMLPGALQSSSWSIAVKAGAALGFRIAALSPPCRRETSAAVSAPGPLDKGLLEAPGFRGPL